MPALPGRKWRISPPSRSAVPVGVFQTCSRPLAAPVRLAEPVELERLAALDLTGAGIAAIVRSAALMAHAEGRDALTLRDILVATNKQFQREARLLPRELLGAYASLAG